MVTRTNKKLLEDEIAQNNRKLRVFRDNKTNDLALELQPGLSDQLQE